MNTKVLLLSSSLPCNSDTVVSPEEIVECFSDVFFVEVVALISIYDNSYMIYSSQKNRVFHPENIIPLFNPPLPTYFT